MIVISLHWWIVPLPCSMFHLLTIFVERWHKETSVFHLPFGEMVITLDDVSSMFHLILSDDLFTSPLISHQLTHITPIQMDY